MYKHIEAYVNNYTLNLGKDGREAIKELYKRGLEAGAIKKVNKNLFLT